MCVYGWWNSHSKRTPKAVTLSEACISVALQHQALCAFPGKTIAYLLPLLSASDNISIQGLFSTQTAKSYLAAQALLIYSFTLSTANSRLDDSRGLKVGGEALITRWATWYLIFHFVNFHCSEGDKTGTQWLLDGSSGLSVGRKDILRVYGHHRMACKLIQASFVFWRP